MRGVRTPDFGVLGAKIASALNRVIHNTQFNGKVSLEEEKIHQKGPFPSWKTERLLDLRVLPGHWSQRFCREPGIRFEVGRNSIIIGENSI